VGKYKNLQETCQSTVARVDNENRFASFFERKLYSSYYPNNRNYSNYRFYRMSRIDHYNRKIVDAVSAKKVPIIVTVNSNKKLQSNFVIN
jgi:hypothetical protein